MMEYRAYILGPDGQIVKRVDLICKSEEEAKKRVEQMVDGHAIELWEGARRIARFDPQ
jgi:hypothetical protein